MRYLALMAFTLILAACGCGGGDSGGSTGDDNLGGGTPTTPGDSSAPASPSGGTVVQDANGNAVITWVDNSDDETGFFLQRKVGDQESFTLLDKVGDNVTTYTDDSVISGKTYSYRVFATRDGDSSDSYTEVSITIANTGREDTYAKAYQLGEDQKFYISRLFPLDGGEAIVLGGADEKDRFVSRIDATGAPIWTRYIESEDTNEVHTAAWLQSEEALYVVGQVNPDPESSDLQALGAGRFILDLDTGEILASKYLRLADMQIHKIHPADENNDGLYDALVLVTQNFRDQDYFVVKTDLDLNVKWSKEITELDAFGGLVASVPDGSTFFAAQIREPVYMGDRYLYLAKFDITGNLIFQRHVTFGEGIPEIALYSMHTLSTDDEIGSYRLVLSGSAVFEPESEYPISADTWLLALDVSGEAVWKKRIDTDIYMGASYQGSDRPLLLTGSTDTSAYYGSITVGGELGPVYEIENELELDIESAAGLGDGSKLFEIETKQFDPSYVGIIAKVDADNNIPRLANGLVAEPVTIDTLDFPVKRQAETFSVVDWVTGSPIDIQKRNSAVEVTVTDLVGK